MPKQVKKTTKKVASKTKKQFSYEKPIFMLPFDHRASFSKELLKFTPPLSKEQAAQVTAMKQIVYEGFLAAASKRKNKDWFSILVDEEYGRDILSDARKRGYVLATPAEKSGQEEFQFDHNDWQEHILAMRPNIVKVLVRYNPEGDKKMNARQLVKLAKISKFCKQHSVAFLFELLVPPSKKQQEKYGAKYDIVARPKLEARAITEISKKVAVDIWKVEAMSHNDWKAVVRATRSAKTKTRPVIIMLGRHAPNNKVRAWLTAASGYEDITGFAVGRTVFFEPLELLRDKKISRDEAVKRIADSFDSFATFWAKKKKIKL